MMRPSRAKQHGVALITALLIVALATTAAVAMVSRQQLDIRRTGNVLGYDQASLYAEGAEAWVGRLLQRDLDKGQVDHLGESWAMVLPPMPIEGGQLAGTVEDMQGRFNLNGLVKGDEVDTVAVERFRRLLFLLELDPELVGAVVDWIDADPDFEPGLPGAEDGEYLGLEVPYRTPNRPMTSATELRLVKGVTPEVYRKLAPYVTALPNREAGLNVNTIPIEKPELVMMLADHVDRPAAEAAISGRGDKGYQSPREFVEKLSGEDISTAGLTVASNHFMLTSIVSVGRMNLTTHSLLHRDANGTRLVQRYQGNF